MGFNYALVLDPRPTKRAKRTLTRNAIVEVLEGGFQWLGFIGENCFRFLVPAPSLRRAEDLLQFWRPGERLPTPRPPRCTGYAGTISFPPPIRCCASKSSRLPPRISASRSISK